MSHKPRPDPTRSPATHTSFKDDANKKTSKGKSKSKAKSVNQWFDVYNLHIEDLKAFLIEQFPEYETTDFKISVVEDEDGGEQYLFKVPHKLTGDQRRYIKQHLVMTEEERDSRARASAG